MNFAVIGGGAVGMLTASLLKEAGAGVQLVVRREEQAKAINDNGILMGNVRSTIHATTAYNDIHPEAFILLAVKYDALENVIAHVKKECPHNPVVFLQNGMLHLNYLKQLPNSQIAAGSVEHGALKISDNKVSHTGKGKYKIALLRGTKETFLPLLDLNGVKAEWHDNADELLLRKLLLNSIINPLTALMNIKNGELLSNLYAYELLKNLYTELYSGFPEIENLLPFEEVTALCASTSANTSSMLADKLAGRKMELDTILLYALNRSPVDLPVLRSLYHLLKAAEAQ